MEIKLKKYEETYINTNGKTSTRYNYYLITSDKKVSLKLVYSNDYKAMYQIIVE